MTQEEEDDERPDGFVTLKIRADFHRWLKLRAVEAGKNMYELVEQLVAGIDDQTGEEMPRPWR